MEIVAFLYPLFSLRRRFQLRPFSDATPDDMKSVVQSSEVFGCVGLNEMNDVPDSIKCIAPNDNVVDAYVNLTTIQVVGYYRVECISVDFRIA